MRLRVVLVCGCALAVLSVSGCSKGEVEVATAAVRQGGEVLGHSAGTVVLSGDDVSRLATEAGVGESVVRDVAPALDQQRTWRSSLTGAQALGSQVADQTQTTLLATACDIARGEVRTEQDLYASVAASFPTAPAAQVQQLVADTEKLWQQLRDAWVTGTGEDRAAVEVTCYTLQRIDDAG
jgi:hypothetical protein